MRILAVDHGEKRIGLAISDPTGRIASPLKVIEHVSRLIDAARVVDLAVQNDAGLIVVGQSFDEEGRPNLDGRRAARFAQMLETQTQIPIVLWDESFSTTIRRSRRSSTNAWEYQGTLENGTPPRRNSRWEESMSSISAAASARRTSKVQGNGNYWLFH